MANKDKKEHFGILLDLWAQASHENNHREALLHAITGYLVFRGLEDADAFLGPIESASMELLKPHLEEAKRATGEKAACSFCGRGEPEVKLGAGPGVFICNSCVNAFSEIFKDRK
jgi:hypothetical protein